MNLVLIDVDSGFAVFGDAQKHAAIFEFSPPQVALPAVPAPREKLHLLVSVRRAFVYRHDAPTK
jgi:hypothetical protein